MFTKYTKPIVLLIVICLLFFYKTIVLGKLPFPGDLLVSGYSPWNHQSYAGYVVGAVPSKDQYFDVVRELYPWKTVVVEELKKGVMPLWNPYNFSGSPLLANYQSQVFYPLTLLYFFLPQPIAWTAMTILQPMLGSVFLYLFATEIGITSAGAILAAILFNFSSFSNVWMEFTTVWHTILWLPLLLYLTERAVRQKKLAIGQQTLYMFALYSAITGGHPQDFINSFIFLTIYTLVRKSFSVVPLMVIPFLLSAPQLFPTIELFQHSARVAHDYLGIIKTMLVQWWQLPLLAVTDFFGNPATKNSITGDFVGKTLSVGIVGFALAAIAIRNKFFTWAAIAVLLLTVRTPLSEFLYRYPWPILSTGTPTRILFILMLCLSILAGFGFDALQKNTMLAKKPLMILWIIMGVLWVYSPMRKTMILPTVLLVSATAVVVLSKYKKILLLALIPLAVGELFYSFIKFNPFVPPTFVFPENRLITKLQEISGINRFWAYGTGEIEANFATQEKLYSPDGTDPLNLRWYNQFIQSNRDGKIAQKFNRTTRSDAILATGYGETDLPENKFRLRVMDALGVKYILDRAENPKNDNTFPLSRFKLLDHVDDWTIYENLHAAPRFFLTVDVRPYRDTGDFEKQFFAPEFQPGKTILISESDFNTLPTFSESDSVVTLEEYTPTNIRFRASATTPTFLFLSDTFDTGWKATINGKPVRVYQADFAFRGVVVPEGASVVVFSYRPKSFQAGVVVSIIALSGATLYLLYQKKLLSRR